MPSIRNWYYKEGEEDRELTKIIDDIVDKSPIEQMPDTYDNLQQNCILKQIKTEVSSYESSSPSTSIDSVIVPFKSSPLHYQEYETVSGVTEAPTECRVCGLPTNCYHYSTPSCNGCKTFFRRTLIMGKQHVCRFKNVCNVRGGSRCRACRFDQCILAGMDPNGICYPKDFNSESAIEEVNRRKRALLGNETAVIPTKCVQRFEQTLEARIVDNLGYLEMKFRRLRESTFNARSYYELNVREILGLGCEIGNADKYEKPSNWPLPPSHFLQCFHKEMDPSKPCNGNHWLTTDLILNIEYLKALPFFHELNLDDQEALVMHINMVNTVLVQSWYSYKNNCRTLTLPDGRTPIINIQRKSELLGQDYPGISPMEMDVFCRNIDPLYRVAPDTEEYILLKAIIFCHSDAPGLSEHAQGVLEKHRDIYASTLLRRMQARLGTLPGARKYADILGLVEAFFHFAQKKREFHVLLYTLRQSHPFLSKGLPTLFERFIVGS